MLKRPQRTKGCRSGWSGHLTVHLLLLLRRKASASDVAGCGTSSSVLHRPHPMLLLHSPTPRPFRTPSSKYADSTSTIGSVTRNLPGGWVGKQGEAKNPECHVTRPLFHLSARSAGWVRVCCPVCVRIGGAAPLRSAGARQREATYTVYGPIAPDSGTGSLISWFSPFGRGAMQSWLHRHIGVRIPEFARSLTLSRSGCMAEGVQGAKAFAPPSRPILEFNSRSGTPKPLSPPPLSI
jgi:hypothetical protein